MSCNDNANTTKTKKEVRLITLDPGYFHASLVQKSMYKNVGLSAYVLAPWENDLQLHPNRVNTYNSRKQNPTYCKEEVYSDKDLFEKMHFIKDEKGNVSGFQ